MKKFLTLLILSIFTTNAATITTKHKRHHRSSKKNHQPQSSSSRTHPIPLTDPIMQAATKNPNPSAVNTTLHTRQPRLYSYSAYAMDAVTGNIYISKNPTEQLPIASLTKLMTAMLVLDSKAPLEQDITISDADVDRLRNTYSRLKVGIKLKRRDLLLLALMSSENRAAHALARTAYPGGTAVFINKMNTKAKELGMKNTRFYDPTGLTVNNTSTAIDLVKMVAAAYKYDLIRTDTTTKGADIMLSSRYMHHYLNSDALVRGDKLNIQVSKTGFINEAGHCLALYTMVENHPIAMVFLNSSGKSGRLIDAMSVSNYIARNNN
jgi:D-alanyl-D-alanine endopeptidase (penicillin-binding protein 7)